MIKLLGWHKKSRQFREMKISTSSGLEMLLYNYKTLRLAIVLTYLLFWTMFRLRFKKAWK